MKIQSFIRKFSTIIGLISLTSIVQAAVFNLPDRTPGFIGQTNVPFHAGNPKNYEKVTVPGTTCDLFFPIDGHQPITQAAGVYSGARYNGPNNDAVTDWWVRVFGGNTAVNQIHNGMYDRLMAPRMGFKINGHNSHIIRVDTRNIPAGFERQFWQTFRTIAADPVGRVLLYRLLIEIRRLDRPGGNGCLEDGIIIPNIAVRNNLRSIEIHSNNKSTFSYKKKKININLQNKNHKTLKIENGCLTTADENSTGDISLFHEMVHWFHHLRHHQRCLDNKRSAGFKYAMRSYYGNSSELKYWGRKPKVTLEGNSEEIATILGSPNYNDGLLLPMIHWEAFLPYDAFRGLTIQIQPWKYIPTSDKFLNGDDLSENAYRASRGQRMRFGHKNRSIEPVTMHPIPNRFQLAHQVAATCYTQITGNAPQNWDLAQGEAIQP